MLALALLVAAFPAWAGGSIEVRATVPGGRITVDGADTGLTAPAVVEGVQPGVHQVAVSGHCRRGEVQVAVAEGHAARADITVREIGGTLVLRLEPSFAEVRMDGAPYPGAPGEGVPVSCGDHALGATLDGYMPVFVNFDVGEGERVELPVTLQAIGRGHLRIALEPDTARVVLDGLELGRGDQDVRDLPAGPHLVQAELAGFQGFEQNVIVNAGLEQALDIHLAPLPAPVVGGGGPRAGRTWGAVFTAGGGAALMSSGALLLTARGRYQDYLARAEAINAGRSSETAASAHAFRQDQVVPVARAGVAAGIAGAVLGGTGVALLVRY